MARRASIHQVDAVYIISVAAELAGMHPQTLRMYEQKGLLAPARTEGGSRRYSDGDIENLRAIQELTNQGVNLEGVRKILEMRDEMRRVSEEMDRVRDEMVSVIRETERQFRRDLVPYSGHAVEVFRRRQS